jgi:hypothetical protein
MSVRNMSPSLQRSRSALDHLGIDVAARLLLAGIWLERQFGNAPKLLTTVATESAMSGVAANVPPLSASTSRQFLRDVR